METNQPGSPRELLLKHGIDVGEKGQSIQPALDTLRDLGLIVNRKTLSAIRGNKETGIDDQGLEIADTFAAAITLTRGSAQAKNNFYHYVSQRGIALQEHQVKPKAHRLRSSSFADNLSELIPISLGDLGKVMRNMRLDLIYEQRSQFDPEIDEKFKDLVRRYLDDYSKPKSAAHPATTRIASAWNNGSIENFYRAIYSQTNVRKRGTWFPYEVEIFEHFYRLLQSRLHEFTSFDKMILEERMRGLFNPSFNRSIANDTGVNSHYEDLVLHKNLLIWGQFTYPRNT